MVARSLLGSQKSKEPKLDAMILLLNVMLPFVVWLLRKTIAHFSKSHTLSVKTVVWGHFISQFSRFKKFTI